ncbi:MAG: DUF4339 domain-containing protein [Bdellovibrionaceae bacterium]|nr:DUF4339 domain-containing protein [Pseudobdellovibrionaceae bacterium]
MSRWYYAHKGKTVGPFAQNEILQMVVAGQIGVMDLVFKVGGQEWKPLIEWSEFEELKARQSKNSHEEQWIVFMDRPEERKQIGPFSTLQVQEMLKDNSIQFEDYIWKEGMSEWYPIKTIHEFKAKKDTSISFNVPETNEDVSVYEESAADLLRSIKVKDPKQIKEITETISSFTKEPTSTLTNKNTIKENHKNNEVSSKEERQKRKEEMERVRKQLDDKIKYLFGDQPNLTSEDTRWIQDKTILNQQATSMLEVLPLTQRLLSEGFIESKEEKELQELDESEKGNPSVAPVVNILKDESFFEQKENKWLRRIQIELEALFPKGSVLRIFALFFMFFASTLMIFLSSNKDKSIMIAQKNTATETMKKVDEKIFEEERRAKEIADRERERIEKDRLANIKRPPTQITLKIFKNQNKGRELFIQSDASKHYKYRIEVIGHVGKVLGLGAYYNTFEIPTKDSVRLSFEKMQLPEGYLTFRVTVNDLEKTKRIYNSEKNKNSFAEAMEEHKKQIAIWHQKEKRSLYSTIESLKNWGLQLSSLIPLHQQSQKRWQRAYRNWKNKVSANQSDYLKTVNLQVKGKFIYPELWLKLKSQMNVLYNIPSATPEFDYVSFKNKILALEKEVNELSLW